MNRKQKKVILLGAGGREFHNFNVHFRNNPRYKIVAFTATQIPDIEGRVYPFVLSGRFYPRGIPIYPETELPYLIKKHKIDEVVFSYSDVSHEHVMRLASLVISCGADFKLLGLDSTSLKSKVPVIAVCAVRTGAGKSQVTRKIASILKEHGKNVVVVRHPMPYGNLKKQIVQRFVTYSDLDKERCTIEEREEYEPLIDRGVVVYAGADYEKILRRAEKEADLIIWDGGNNDIPFFKPDLHLVLVDPHRAGDEIKYHPGEANFRMADVIMIGKQGTADPKAVRRIRKTIKSFNPKATVINAKSVITVDEPKKLFNKSVLVVEDGPTVTHGGMVDGAGMIAAKLFRRKIKKVVNPRRYAVGAISRAYEKYPHIGRVLPALGYGARQIRNLERTINNAKCKVVISGTPIDLSRIMKINKPMVRVRYEIKEIGRPRLEDVIKEFL